jgi:hypothetical protein
VVCLVEMSDLVTKLLGSAEEVEACACFPTHVRRWMIVENRRIKVYLHHSCDEDWAFDLRRYPARFISIGLVNSCIDHSDAGLEPYANRAAWMVLIVKS